MAPKVIAYLAAIAGTAYIAQGAVIGNDGFSALSGHIGPIALVFDFAWIAAFAVSTRRARPESPQPAPAARGREPVTH